MSLTHSIELFLLLLSFMEEKEGIKERLLTFIDYLRIRKSEYERRCGLSNGYINSIKSDIGVQKLISMIKTFPQLNPYWVATGNGEMLISAADNIQKVGGDPLAYSQNPEVKPYRELTYEEKYEKVMAMLAEIHRCEELNQERIAQLREVLKMKEDQINRLLNLVDKLNYNQTTPE